MNASSRDNDDHSLLARIAEGDKDAIKSLYERHHDALFGFLRRQCNDEFLSADLVHEVMMQVWRGAKSYSGKSSPKTWIFAIARNKLIDRFRASSRLSFVEDVPETEDETPNAEAVIENAQDAARVRHCVAQLSERHRAAVELAFFQDLSYEEISEIEKTPTGTIKTRIHHAKKLLMRCLGRRE